MAEETRVALLPGDLGGIRHPENLYFEHGYARHLGCGDDEYRRRGANVIPRSGMARLDVLCIPRPSPKDRDILRHGMTVWGWPYVEDNPWCAKTVVERALTVVDFHFMYHDGEYVFRANSHLAGRLGMMQALLLGRPPGRLGNVAMLGKGHLARGAMETLDALRVPYTVFDRGNSCELLSTIHAFKTIVNCIKWYEEGFLIAREHIARMQEDAFIVDLSTEGIEGIVPHSVHAPVYRSGRMLIYACDHIPALCPAHASAQISRALAPHVDKIVEDGLHPVTEEARVIVAGKATAAAGKLARMALARAS